MFNILAIIALLCVIVGALILIVYFASRFLISIVSWICGAILSVFLTVCCGAVFLINLIF